MAMFFKFMVCRLFHAIIQVKRTHIYCFSFFEVVCVKLKLCVSKRYVTLKALRNKVLNIVILKFMGYNLLKSNKLMEHWNPTRTSILWINFAAWTFDIPFRLLLLTAINSSPAVRIPSFHAGVFSNTWGITRDVNLMTYCISLVCLTSVVRDVTYKGLGCVHHRSLPIRKSKNRNIED